jgi:two-component system sensor histidine kinase GlrK
VVSIMRDNSVKLQRLIEELLDYQRALHAAASLEVRTVALDDLVRDAVRSHELAAQAKGLRLTIEAQAASLEADPQKLRSIVDNLVSNAVKFTPSGGTITVRARAMAGEAVIEVLDTGPGVPAEERESIFNLFFRGRTKADPGREGGIKGSGQIAVMPNGTGGAAGAAHGAHFRVTLPRRSARALADAA